MRTLLALLLLTPLAVGTARAQTEQPWQPAAEPEHWAEVRRTLLRLGPPRGLASRRWVFLRGLDRDDLRAGEYLAELRATADGSEPMAEFTGVVLLQRPTGEAAAWQVRERRLRLFCRQGRMEVMAPDGSWQAYPGSDDPAAGARQAWICAEALRRSGAVGPDRAPSAQ